MNQKTQYSQLQPEDRMTIASMRQQGRSVRAMALTLGRSPSTVSRELERNTLAGLPYGSHTAQAACEGRRVAARSVGKLDFSGVGWATVRTLLDWKWSPQQIAATLKRVFPDEPERHVSHETIYTAIYAQPRGELRKQLVACLRQGRGKPYAFADPPTAQASVRAWHAVARNLGRQPLRLCRCSGLRPA